MLMGNWERLTSALYKVRKVSQALREIKALLVMMEQLALKARKVILERQVQQDHKESKVYKDHKAQQALDSFLVAFST